MMEYKEKADGIYDWKQDLLEENLADYPFAMVIIQLQKPWLT